MKKTAVETESNHAPAAEPAKPRTLAVDVGGTGVKTIVLDRDGAAITERTRMPTPKAATPKQLLEVICKLAKKQGEFERVSAGFPGVIKDGIVYTAANLGRGWRGFDLRGAIQDELERPVRVANDADIQGLGAIAGHGIELVITLGTGFGSVIFTEGRPIHLELGHHPFRRGKTYEDELGERALKKKGRKKWLKALAEALDELARTFNYDALYIGGGNSRLVNFSLPEHVKIISNLEGLLGGIKLWEGESGEAEPAVPRGPVSEKAKAKAKAKTKSKGKAKEVADADSSDGNGVAAEALEH
ncbi:MAG TPA: ROK family protein [Candidatus Binataceae bacterium]|nr:ROK family protein [Candidatus Binataceae bacterium]